MEYVIQAEHLMKVYGAGRTKNVVLKGVDIAVRRSELVIVTGPSGSGKSTLLHILGLVEEPTEGRLVLDGEDIYGGGAQPDYNRIRREKIGFIFQFPNLIPFLTGKENVLVPMDLVGIGGQQAEDRAQELLKYLGVAERADDLPEHMSGGEKQRVMIARALANKPKMILADEPTASLDAERGLSVMRVLRKIGVEQGTAILVVTHDTRMFGKTDRVIYLLDGKIMDRPTEALAG
ncbi:MAG: ABC transporter ATP-binding protein [Pirellulaceae bacterium]